MLEQLGEEQKIVLKLQFDSLSSIPLKTEFWLNNFQKPYFLNYIYDFKVIKDFYIYPKLPEEFEELNLICLEEMSIYGLGKFKVLRLNTEIENFQLSLLKAKNKKYLVDKELERVSLIKSENENSKNPLDAEIKNFWLHGYNEAYINSSKSHLSKTQPSPKLLAALNNGFIIGEYQKYIEGILDDIRTNRDTFTKEKTSLRQQILILESTGLLDHIENTFKTQSEKRELIKKDLILFLSVLLNASEQSIKEVLTDLPKKAHLYNVKTLQNYDYLIELFETVGLKEHSKTVQNEKVEYNKKKSIP